MRRVLLSFLVLSTVALAFACQSFGDGNAVESIGGGDTTMANGIGNSDSSPTQKPSASLPPGYVEPKKGDSTYKQVSAIMDTLTQIMANKGNADSKTVFKVAKDLISKGKLKIIVDTNNQNIIRGSSFEKLPSGAYAIVVGTGLLNFFDQMPTLTLASFMHEFQYAYYAFEEVNTYKAMANDPLTRYGVHMQTYYLEAIFIYDYLLPLTSIGAYEQFIVESLNNDELQSVSLLFERTDIGVFNKLMKIDEAASKKTGKAKAAFMKDLTALGDELKTAYEKVDKGDDKAYYQALAGLNTYIQLGNRLGLVLTGYWGKSATDKAFDSYGNFVDLQSWMSAEYAKEQSFMDDYQNNAITSFERAYLKSFGLQTNWVPGK